MNLYFRLLQTIINALFAKRIRSVRSETCKVFRVLPNDLDLGFHMNNGRFVTVLDLCRVDLFVRTGLARLMLKNGWVPLVAEIKMEYLRPLKLFQKYEVKFRVTGWDDKFIYSEHSFISGGKTVAEGKSKGCVRASTGVIHPDRLISLLDLNIA